MKNKKKNMKNVTFFKANQRIFGALVLLASFFIVLNATSAWTSFTEWVINHLQVNPTEVSVAIVEEFEQGTIVDYTDDVKKEVKVKNTSNQPAIVRVKLNESFLPFEMDLSNGEGHGNGSLKMRPKETTDKEIEQELTSTWQVGNIFDSGIKKENQAMYYIATSPVYTNLDYLFQDESNRKKEFKNFRLNFHQEVKPIATTEVTGVTTAWYYDDGFFYYSKVLAGGETTAIDLLQSISAINGSLGNRFKHAFYNIEVEAYGAKPTGNSLLEWTSNQALMDMYAYDADFKLNEK